MSNSLSASSRSVSASNIVSKSTAWVDVVDADADEEYEEEVEAFC